MLRLDFSGLGWNNEDMVALAKVLPDAPRLRILVLDDNADITEEGIAALGPSIEHLFALSLAGTGVIDKARLSDVYPKLYVRMDLKTQVVIDHTPGMDTDDQDRTDLAASGHITISNFLSPIPRKQNISTEGPK